MVSMMSQIYYWYTRHHPVIDRVWFLLLYKNVGGGGVIKGLPKPYPLNNHISPKGFIYYTLYAEIIKEKAPHLG